MFPKVEAAIKEGRFVTDGFNKNSSLAAPASLANTEPGPRNASLRKLLESGFLLSAAGLLTGLGNYAFQAIIGRHLSKTEFGLTNGTLIFVGFLSLPLAIATTTVTHYLARFNARGQEAHLQGLLAGCRKFLFRLTLAGSVLAAIVVKPLSDFLHLPRTSLALVALTCVFAALWGSFGTALCQGLAWFKRLALIGLLGAVLRLLFGGVVTLRLPTAEMAILASAVALLANLVLLFWRKELAQRTEVVSPWDREFVQYFVVSAACVGGGFLFTQGDMLVATRNFSEAHLGFYSAAERLAVALPMVVAPLLTVLFTHRSGEHAGSALREQLKYLCFYAAGLLFGAVCLLALRGFCVKIIFGKEVPESADMIGRLALTMVFAGLLQALGLWALASRWLKLALLYGGLGLLYWLTLLWAGKSPAALLGIMPACAGAAFGVLLVAWLIAMRRVPTGSLPEGGSQT